MKNKLKNKQKFWAVVKDNRVVDFVPSDIEMASDPDSFKAISSKKGAAILVKIGLEFRDYNPTAILSNQKQSIYNLCQVEIKILKHKKKKS